MVVVDSTMRSTLISVEHSTNHDLLCFDKHEASWLQIVYVYYKYMVANLLITHTQCIDLCITIVVVVCKLDKHLKLLNLRHGAWGAAWWRTIIWAVFLNLVYTLTEVRGLSHIADAAVHCSSSVCDAPYVLLLYSLLVMFRHRTKSSAKS